MRIIFVFAFSLLLALAGPATGEPIERVKITDNELSCRQMHDELGQMERIIAEAKAAQAEGEKTTLAGQAGGVAAEVASRTGLFAQVGGLFGHIAGTVASKAAADVAAQSGQKSAASAKEREQQALGRKEHLTALFLAKGCKASDPDAPAANPTATVALAVQTAAAPVPLDEVMRKATLNVAPLDAQLPLKTHVINGAGKGLDVNHPRVFVPSFRVAFVVKTKASAYAGGGLANFGNTAASPLGVKTVTQAQNKLVEMALTGVDQKLLQALTDKLYEDFVGRLKASGREVIDWEQVKKTPGFDKIRFTEKNPYTVDSSWTSNDKRSYIVLTPTGMRLFFLAQSTERNSLSDTTIGLETSRALAEVATNLDAVAMIPTVQIDIAEIHSSGRSRWQSGAEADLIPKLGLAEGSGLIVSNGKDLKIFYAGDLGTAWMEKPFYVDGDFGTVKTVEAFDTASLANALTAVTGAQGVQHFVDKRELRVDPVKYAQGVMKLGATLNEHALAAFR